jgi:hypothetical protein
MSSFGGNALFRNFLVDFCNNPFAIEALENDPENTPVVAQLLKEHRDTLFRCSRASAAMLVAQPLPRLVVGVAGGLEPLRLLKARHRRLHRLGIARARIEVALVLQPLVQPVVALHRHQALSA